MKPGAREHIHLPAHLGEALADKVAGQLGSWHFIAIQTIILALWLMVNSVAFLAHFDPAPFILLNLCLSFQGAFTGPIVLLSQNRQAVRDRRRDDVEADEVAQLYASHELLLTINKQQLEILQLLQGQGEGSPGLLEERLLHRLDTLEEEVLTCSQQGFTLLSKLEDVERRRDAEKKLPSADTKEDL